MRSPACWGHLWEQAAGGGRWACQAAKVTAGQVNLSSPATSRHDLDSAS